MVILWSATAKCVKQQRCPRSGKDRVRPGQAHQKVAGPAVYRHLHGDRFLQGCTDNLRGKVATGRAK